MKKIIALLLAVVMVTALFAGCGSSGSTDGEIATIKWVQVGSGMPANYDAWKANLDKYLEEKIGVHIEMEIVGWGDWDQRRNVMVSTNEPYDIMFTNNGTFKADVEQGAFLDITEMVKTAAPGLVDLIPADYWDACSLNGKVYGVPTYKDSSCTEYFVYDQAKVDATGLDYANMHTLSDLTPLLTAVKEADGGQSPFVLSQGGLDAIYGAKYDNLGTGLPAIGVSYTSGKKEVVSVFEQADVLADLEVLHDWYVNGIVNADAPQLSEAPSYRAAFVAQGWSLAAKTTWGPGMGVDAVAIQWGDTVLSNDTVQGSMSCISASSKNPEKALALLNLVNTDSYVRDALYFGLEGDNFNYVDGKVHKNNTDWTMAGYTQGTFFNVTMQDTEEFNQWDEVKELNGQAKPSPALGVSVDTSSISDQIAACNAIFTAYRAQLMTGAGVPSEVIGQMLTEMRASGLDEIIAECNAQLNK